MIISPDTKKILQILAFVCLIIALFYNPESVSFRDLHRAVR